MSVAEEPDWYDEIAQHHPKYEERKASRQPAAGARPFQPVDTTNLDPRQRAYVKGVLDSAFERVSTAAMHTRNDTLNIEAYSTHRKLVQQGFVGAEELRNHLLTAARMVGLPDWESNRTINSAFGGGERAGSRPAVPTADAPNVQEVSGFGDGDEFDAEGKSDGPVDWKTVSGGAFILDVPDTIPTVWGTDEGMLWIEGESLMIAGGQGLGKTTLAGQLLAAQIRGGEVLDLPVKRLGEDDKVLYLAMDRPRQIARSLSRQFKPADRGLLDAHLVVRPGPPMADLAANTGLLTAMAQDLGCTYIYIDSLKDAAVGLVDDEIAAKWNRARQTALSEGIQLCELHHNKKHKSGENWDISDVYGSNWITAGLGSIIMLTGAPGDPIVGFRHIKQPSEEIGPFRLEHDQASGTMTIHHDVDLLALARAAQPEGLTAKAAACAIFDTEVPTRGDMEKARRRLGKLAEAGWLMEHDAGTGRGNAATWHPIAQVDYIHDEREWTA